MAEPRLPPSPLERAIGQLVEAGVVEPDHLAACLGLEPRHVARPLRHLVLASAVRHDADGALRLTDAGRAWLAVATIVPTGDMAGAPPRPAPRLRPLDLGREVARLPAETPDTVDSPARQPRSPVPQLRLPRIPALTLPRRKRPTVALVVTVALALVVVGGVVLGARAGLAERNVSTTGALLAGPAPRAAATPAPATAVTALATASPAPTSAAPRPLLHVAHTEGLGLVLRPQPGSPARLRTLPDGTPLWVTGDSVQLAGRAWLPVQAPAGDAGWVAADFLDPSP